LLDSDDVDGEALAAAQRRLRDHTPAPTTPRDAELLRALGADQPPPPLPPPRLAER
jgi:hypothetical protein